MRKFGVEEEFLLVGEDGAPIGVATEAVAAHERHASETAEPNEPPGGGVDLELQRQQLETGTHPCQTTDEMVRELRDGRRRLGEAAAQAGASLAALGTSPIDVGTRLSPSRRFRRMGREYGLTAREQLTCGCHVHVEVADPGEGVAILDRIGPWLPVLLAISANSPFWHGTDSGYASYRSQVWNRWPTAGPTAPFGSIEAYERAVSGLIETGAVLDQGMIYFDARLSARYPTVEIRVADVCLFASDALLVATLARALVETAARAAAGGLPPTEDRVERLRAATWRAGRSGLSGVLVSPTDFRPTPAWQVVESLVAHLRPVLVEQDELEVVTDLLAGLRERGTGAQAQHRWAVDGWAAVVDKAVAATAG